MRNRNSYKSSTVIFITLLVSFLVTIFVGNFANKAQKDIAKSVLRLHVIANSNTEFDQDLKLKVRDAVINEMTSKFKLSNNINETRQIAMNNIKNIENVSKNVIDDLDIDYDVKVSVGDSYFPTKHYGDMSFPPGHYEAIKVEIGEANGKNWWCVLFPPLCFIDATNGSLPEESKSKLKSSLTTEEYELLNVSTSDKVPVKIKFKSVEVWQSSKHNMQVALDKIF